MALFVDARIPVVFGAAPGEADAVLLPSEGEVCAPTHPSGCACCVARGPVTVRLDRLFLDRVRGTIPWFTRVVVPTDDPAIRDAITTDPLLSARFRLVG
jgi:hypothetical protein